MHEWRPFGVCDRLEQAIVDLTRLMGNANKNREEERNLPGDLP